MSGPWIDRDILVKNAKRFTRAHGLFLRRHGPRISSLVEIAVYNSIVDYYKHFGYTATGANLGPKKSFRYKLTSSGLTENYSFFKVQKAGDTFHILHNISIQSSHHDHMYFTADVVISNRNGATTQKLKSGRRHSFVSREDLITFAEVKHLNPFPEVLFNFMGLVLEFMPMLVEKTCVICDSGGQLCPIIAFTGPGSNHTELIQEQLTKRYGINIVFSTSSSFGALTGLSDMNCYSKPPAVSVADQLARPRRKFVID